MKRVTIVAKHKGTGIELRYNSVRDIAKSFDCSVDTIIRWKRGELVHNKLQEYEYFVRPYNSPIDSESYEKIREMMDYFLTDFGGDVCGKCVFYKDEGGDYSPCGNESKCVDGVLAYFLGVYKK